LSDKVLYRARAVKNRIDKLKENGIIKKFTVIMDYHKLGRAIKAFIGLRCNQQNN